MSVKEQNICIWIHHIATILGLCTGFFKLRAHPENKKGAAFPLLILYITSQLWALLKLLAGLGAKRQPLKKSFLNIKKLCRTQKQERSFLWLLTLLAAGFKLGTPALLHCGRTK